MTRVTIQPLSTASNLLLLHQPAVVTTIHDCQLLEEDIDPDMMLEHDVPVDIIVTPTQVPSRGDLMHECGPPHFTRGVLNTTTSTLSAA